MAQIIVFDVETGGLKVTENPITQIALIAVGDEDLVEKERYTTFVKPYNDLILTEKALEVSLVDKKTLAISPEAKDVVLMLKEFFKKATDKRTKPTLAGHNVSFDIAMLAEMFRFAKSNLMDYINHNNGIAYYYDTRMLMTKCYPELGRYNLSNCCEHCDIPLYDAHGAMGDTEATLLLLKHLFAKMRSGEKSSSKADTMDTKAGKLRYDTNKPFLF